MSSPRKGHTVHFSEEPADDDMASGGPPSDVLKAAVESEQLLVAAAQLDLSALVEGKDYLVSWCRQILKSLANARGCLYGSGCEHDPAVCGPFQRLLTHVNQHACNPEVCDFSVPGACTCLSANMIIAHHLRCSNERKPAECVICSVLIDSRPARRRAASEAPRPAQPSPQEQYIAACAVRMRWLKHAQCCELGECHSECMETKQILHHVSQCSQPVCDNPDCRITQELIAHGQQCESVACPVCNPHPPMASRDEEDLHSDAAACLASMSSGAAAAAAEQPPAPRAAAKPRMRRGRAISAPAKVQAPVAAAAAAASPSPVSAPSPQLVPQPVAVSMGGMPAAYSAMAPMMPMWPPPTMAASAQPYQPYVLNPYSGAVPYSLDPSMMMQMQQFAMQHAAMPQQMAHDESMGHPGYGLDKTSSNHPAVVYLGGGATAAQ